VPHTHLSILETLQLHQLGGQRPTHPTLGITSSNEQTLSHGHLTRLTTIRNIAVESRPWLVHVVSTDRPPGLVYQSHIAPGIGNQAGSQQAALESASFDGKRTRQIRLVFFGSTPLPSFAILCLPCRKLLLRQTTNSIGCIVTHSKQIEISISSKFHCKAPMRIPPPAKGDQTPGGSGAEPPSFYVIGSNVGIPLPESSPSSPPSVVRGRFLNQFPTPTRSTSAY